ncbi:MAG: 1-acyl-sn-glycerol-3-phosphate acyltransferase [Chthoniobacterales bacterium]|nr:1-acyl-sn-glycerol-3-phosphate acyltransferase [Chthoniobacterales bacterium]
MLSDFGYGLGAGCIRIALSPFTGCRIRGASHVPRKGACIIAPNHISHFDPPFIGINAGRPVDWMAMQELFTNPLLGGILRWIGSFPVGRGRMDRAALRTATERLRQGRIVGIFPEGGLRTGPQSVLEGAPIKPGVALLAQLTRAPVLPCMILGTDALYTPRNWIPLRRGAVWIVFGPPLDPPDENGDKEARTEFDNRLGAVLREIYERTLREEHIPTDRLPRSPQRRKGRE